MAGIQHQRDTRVCLIWGNTAKPDTAGSLTAVDFDKTTSLSALTSQALPVEGFTFFNIDIKSRRVNRQTGKRFRTIADAWNDRKGSIPGVTLSMPATKETLDLFLYMALQRVTEGASTPFVKNFQYPTNTTSVFASGAYPSFASDEGAFCGLVFSAGSQTPFSGFEEFLMGCVPTQLRITCSSDQHDGQLWLEADMIGRYWEGTTSYTGTITSASTEPTMLFHINDLGVRKLVAASDCPIYGFGFTIDTGLMFVPFGGTGGGGSTNLVMNGPNVSGFVDFLVDDTNDDVFDFARSTDLSTLQNNTNQIAWGNGTTDADGDLDFTWQAITGPEGVTPVGTEEMRFLWRFDCAEYTSNDAFKVNLANALDRGW